MAAVFPWDGRDHEEQAEVRYNAPLRTQNRQLQDENTRLKRLLRENGIAWSDAVASHPGFQSTAAAAKSGRRRSLRLSALDQTFHKLPHLPVEVVLRIMQFALVAKDPILDPFCKLNPEHTTPAEAKRGPQIAINLLATCRDYQAEGTRIFWAENTFTFTTPEALRRFADLQFTFRKDIAHINLRIIARYYDDERRTHRIDNDYHPDLAKSQSLKVVPRTRDPSSMSRPGFVSRILITAASVCHDWAPANIQRSVHMPGLRRSTSWMRCVPHLARRGPSLATLVRDHGCYQDSSLCGWTLSTSPTTSCLCQTLLFMS